MRGLGPSLANFGVTNVLADPTLELRDTNGALLIFNENWIDDPASAALLSSNGLASQNATESGIFTSVLPGQYTVILAGHRCPNAGVRNGDNYMSLPNMSGHGVRLFRNNEPITSTDVPSKFRPG